MFTESLRFCCAPMKIFWNIYRKQICPLSTTMLPSLSYPPQMHPLTGISTDSQPLAAARVRIPQYQPSLLHFFPGEPYPGPFDGTHMSMLDHFMLQADARSFTATSQMYASHAALYEPLLASVRTELSESYPWATHSLGQ